MISWFLFLLLHGNRGLGVNKAIARSICKRIFAYQNHHGIKTFWFFICFSYMDVSNLHRLLHSWPVDPISYVLDPEINGQWVGYEYRPRTCCSRAVITFTACCRIMSLVKGWLDPDWRDTISPSSLNASLMSRTRSLKIRKTPSPLVVQNCPIHPWPVLTLCVKVTLR